MIRKILTDNKGGFEHDNVTQTEWKFLPGGWKTFLSRKILTLFRELSLVFMFGLCAAFLLIHSVAFLTVRQTLICSVHCARIITFDTTDTYSV